MNSSIISNCRESRNGHFCYFHLPAPAHFYASHSWHVVWAPKPGANDVANKVFLDFRFGNTEVDVLFLKNVWLLRSSIVYCKPRSQMSPSVNDNRTQYLRPYLGLQYITSAITFSRCHADAKTGTSSRN